jgi:hypothetical protein
MPAMPDPCGPVDGAPMSEPDPAAVPAVEPEPPRHRPHRVPFVVLLATVLLAGMLALLGLNTASAANEVAQRKFDAANASLSDVEQQLGRDLSTRQSPADLARAAYKLGLIPAPNPAFLRFNPDGSVTVLGTALTIPAPAHPTPKPTPTTTPTTTRTGHPTTRATPTPPSTTPSPRSPSTLPTGPTATLPGGPR